MVRRITLNSKPKEPDRALPQFEDFSSFCGSLPRALELTEQLGSLAVNKK